MTEIKIILRNKLHSKEKKKCDRLWKYLQSRFTSKIKDNMNLSLHDKYTTLIALTVVGVIYYYEKSGCLNLLLQNYCGEKDS